MEAVTKLKKCPKIKSITVTEEGGLLLKWTKVEGAEKYAVKRALSDKGEFEHVAWAKKCEYTDADVPGDTTCRYKIMAHKKLEGKKASTKLSAVMSAVVSDIPAAENVKIKANAKGEIELSWKKVDSAGGYIVSRRNEFYSQSLPVARTEKCSFTDKKVVSGQPYYYSVQALVKAEEGERQGNFSKVVSCVSLDCGEILETKSRFGKKIDVRIRIVAGADGYILERSEEKDGDFSEVARSSQGTDILFTDKVPSRLKTYYYRVVSYKNVEKTEHRSFPSEVMHAKSR